jgi:hypothetical protein
MNAAPLFVYRRLLDHRPCGFSRSGDAIPMTLKNKRTTMSRSLRIALTATAVAIAAVATVGCNSPMPSAKSPMTFFVTSAGGGKGADLGGLAGADRICQTLAVSAAAGDHKWRAYLSANAMGGAAAVNARDRIGTGPWRNANGVVVAQSVADLHSANNKLTKATAVTEKGAVVNGRGDTPNMHDMLTGSTPDGTATEQTCGNWTSSDVGVAMLGHSDRNGLDDSVAARSWNSSHPSRNCSAPGLVATGGAGKFYCFAAD